MAQKKSGQLKGLTKKKKKGLKGLQSGGKVDKSLGQRASEIKNQLRSGDAFTILSGLKPEDIRGARQTAAVREDFGTNAPSHAATVEAIAGRIGATPAQLVGLLQELPAGIANREKGQSFFTTEGESGFSIPDIVANAAGAAQSNPLNIPALLALTAGRFLGEEGGATRGIAEEGLASLGDKIGGLLPGRASGGQIPQIAGVRMPTEDALMPAEPVGLQTGGAVQGQDTQVAPVPSVGGFNPFGSGQLGQTAQNTLQNQLQSGNPTDTAAIKQANTQAANQQFQQQAGSINESAGALGLGSSSARTREVSQASANLQGQLAGQNANLDFAASEAAKGRQAGAFNPFLQASGQTLQSNLTQGQLGTQQALGQANISSNELQQNRGISAGADEAARQRDFLAQQQNAQQQFQAGLGGFAQPTGGSAFGGFGGSGGGGFGGLPGAGIGGGRGGGFAVGFREDGGNLEGLQTGGRVRFGQGSPTNSQPAGGGDFRDFISNKAFGQTFDRPQFQFNTPDFSRRRDDSAGGGSSRSRRREPDADDRLREARNLAILNDKFAEKAFNRQRGARLADERAARAPRFSPTPVINQQFGVGTINANRAPGGSAFDTNIATRTSAGSGAAMFGGGSAARGATSRSTPAGRQDARAARASALNNPVIQQMLAGQAGSSSTSNNLSARRQSGGIVPGSPQGGDTVPAEVGQPDGKPDVMLQGQEGIVPLDVMSRLQNFGGQPGEAEAIVSTLRDIMNHQPGPRGPEETGQDPGPGPMRRQVGGSVFNRSALFGQGADDFSQPIPTDQSVLGSAAAQGVVPQFSNDSFRQGDQGSPSQVFVNGVDQSSQLASSQLQSAQLKRRAAFFDSLIAQSPMAAQGRLSQRRDEALGQAALFDKQSEAELTRQAAIQQQVIQSQGLINQGATAAGIRAAGAAQDSQSQVIADAQKAFGAMDETQLAALGNPSPEEFIIRFAAQRGVQLGGGIQQEASEAEQQRVFQEREALGPGQGLPVDPEARGIVGGTIKGAERLGGAFLDQLGQTFTEGPSVFIPGPSSELTTLPGASSGELSGPSQLLARLDKAIAGNAQGSNLPREDILVAQQIVKEMKKNFDAMAARDDQQGAVELAQFIAAFEQRLQALGIKTDQVDKTPRVQGVRGQSPRG